VVIAVELESDVLTDPGSLHLIEPLGAKAIGDHQPLRVVYDWLEGDQHLGYKSMPVSRLHTSR
jgi:hypothetical protein